MLSSSVSAAARSNSNTVTHIKTHLIYYNTTTERVSGRSGFRSDCLPIEAHCENCVTILSFVVVAVSR